MIKVATPQKIKRRSLKDLKTNTGEEKLVNSWIHAEKKVQIHSNEIKHL